MWQPWRRDEADTVTQREIGKIMSRLRRRHSAWSLTVTVDKICLLYDVRLTLFSRVSIWGGLGVVICGQGAAELTLVELDLRAGSLLITSYGKNIMATLCSTATSSCFCHVVSVISFIMSIIHAYLN